MTLPVPSLIALSGAPSHPAPLGRAALLVIDAQMEYVSGKLPLAGVGAALTEIAALLDLARSRGVPVIHVAHISPAGRPLFDTAGPHAAFAPEAAPRDGEAVVTKILTDRT